MSLYNSRSNYSTLLPISGFVPDKKLPQNASKFAIYMKWKTKKAIYIWVISFCMHKQIFESCYVLLELFIVHKPWNWDECSTYNEILVNFKLIRGVVDFFFKRCSEKLVHSPPLSLIHSSSIPYCSGVSKIGNAFICYVKKIKKKWTSKYNIVWHDHYELGI